MLLRGWQAELLYGENEVLAAAKMLVNDQTIRQITCNEIIYVHMLFENHEIVLAEGCWSESYCPSKENVDVLDRPARLELLEMFPELASTSIFNSARNRLKMHETQVFSGLF
jgi:hypothetical protein